MLLLFSMTFLFFSRKMFLQKYLICHYKKIVKSFFLIGLNLRNNMWDWTFKDDHNLRWATMRWKLDTVRESCFLLEQKNDLCSTPARISRLYTEITNEYFCKTKAAILRKRKYCWLILLHLTFCASYDFGIVVICFYSLLFLLWAEKLWRLVGTNFDIPVIRQWLRVLK